MYRIKLFIGNTFEIMIQIDGVQITTVYSLKNWYFETKVDIIIKHNNFDI